MYYLSEQGIVSFAFIKGVTKVMEPLLKVLMERSAIDSGEALQVILPSPEPEPQTQTHAHAQHYPYSFYPYPYMYPYYTPPDPTSPYMYPFYPPPNPTPEATQGEQ